MINSKKILGLDLGEKTLGVAISDSSHLIARPYELFRFKNHAYEDAIEYIVELSKNEDFMTIVVGLPKHMHNEEGEKAKIARSFAEKLEEKGFKTVLVDERYSTKIATKSLIEGNFSRKKRKNMVDKMAAQVILQNYLDKKRKEDLNV